MPSILNGAIKIATSTVVNPVKTALPSKIPTAVTAIDKHFSSVGKSAFPFDEYQLNNNNYHGFLHPQSHTNKIMNHYTHIVTLPPSSSIAVQEPYLNATSKSFAPQKTLEIGLTFTSKPQISVAGKKTEAHLVKFDKDLLQQESPAQYLSPTIKGTPTIPYQNILKPKYNLNNQYSLVPDSDKIDLIALAKERIISSFIDQNALLNFNTLFIFPQNVKTLNEQLCYLYELDITELMISINRGATEKFLISAIENQKVWSQTRNLLEVIEIKNVKFKVTIEEIESNSKNSETARIFTTTVCKKRYESSYERKFFF